MTDKIKDEPSFVWGKNCIGQEGAPIPEAMKKYARDGALAFHTPGHKQGLGAHPLLKELITEQGLREEVSLMEELDDLHCPEGCIKEAQELAAELYGADAAYFMINGTSGAIHAMMMAALRPGDEVLIPRNAHRSMIGGLILTGAVPVFLQPEIDEELGIAMGLSVEMVERALCEHPRARALAMVSPTYYGVASDLRRIAECVHARDMLLLVDEAHGPHLGFSEELPVQAMEAGADLSAVSTHKLLGAMTQASMLLARKGRISLERVRSAASLLQSTSPNQLLLASLDIARLQMAQSGREMVGKAVRIAEKLRREINKVEGLFCFGRERMHGSGAFSLDVTKVTVHVRGLGMSGAEAEHILRHEYKVQCELADAYNVLFLISYADTEEQAGYLLASLRDMAGKYRREQRFAVCVKIPAVPPLRMLPREAFFASSEEVPFLESTGRIAAEQVMFYPPGIPVLCPGDEITKECVDYIREMQELGLKVVGPQDAKLNCLRVMKLCQREH